MNQECQKDIKIRELGNGECKIFLLKIVILLQTVVRTHTREIWLITVVIPTGQ